MLYSFGLLHCLENYYININQKEKLYLYHTCQMTTIAALEKVFLIVLFIVITVVRLSTDWLGRSSS